MRWKQDVRNWSKTLWNFPLVMRLSSPRSLRLSWLRHLSELCAPMVVRDTKSPYAIFNVRPSP